MTGSFVGLNTGLNALLTARRATEVIGNNIANANTEGYSRQDLDLVSLAPAAVMSWNADPTPSSGDGVDIAGIRRYRDAFVDLRYRSATQQFGQSRFKQDSMGRLESIMNEPSDSAISGQMEQFFAAWQDVANDPNSFAARSSLFQKASSLASEFNRINAGLNTEQAYLDSTVGSKVTEINNLASQIAAYNTQVATAKATNQNPNDLMDKRDLAIDKLSKMVNINYTETANGVVNVNIGARALVSANTANTLSAVPDVTNNNFLKVVWTSDSAAATINNGELAGALSQRDIAVSGRIAQVNTMAATMIAQVNAIHSTGVGLDGQTGRAFFSGSNASDISVNPVLAADVNRIGAAANQSTLPTVSFSVGDGSIGLAIASIASTKNMNAGTATLSGFWGGFVSQLGTELNQSKATGDAQEIVLSQVTDERASTSGVSLDQEATDLIRFQHAYEAAARVINTVDEMLDTIINGTGRVGR